VSGIAGIVLAAGRSARMTPRNKLLEPIDGEPMIRRVAANALESGIRPVIVVTGYEADHVGQALGGLDVTLITNPNYADGLSTSLKAGLAVLPSAVDGALICLGDMPEIENSVFHALMAAFTGPSTICVPVHNGRRGNPVLWGNAYFTEMRTLAGDSGAKSLMTRHADQIIEVAVETDSIFRDVDTPADFARLR
jgi:molybdenum cofactor cytidylyltransferase